MTRSTSAQLLGIPQGGGVYAITCTATEQIYIGSSSTLRKRWQGHLSLLNNGKHHIRRLQEAWDKYGREAFTFAVLELCDGNKETLTDREQHYFDTLSPFGERGFNVGRNAMFPGKGRTVTQEQRDAMSDKTGKAYVVTATDGTQQRIIGLKRLRKFCRDNDLSLIAMRAVVYGRANHHKGWHCERVPNDQPHTPIEASKGLTS